MSEPEVTVVVVNYNGAAFVAECLDALDAQQDAPAYQVWVVDNGSTDGSRELLRARRGVRLIESPTNLGFAGGNNLALAEVRTPYAVLLNNDAVPEPGWLKSLVAPFAVDGPGMAAVVGKVLLMDPPGVINSAGSLVDRRGYGADRGYLEPDTGQYEEPAEVFVASACAVAFRMTALRDVDFFDDDFFLYYEDTDLSWRLRSRGWSIRYEPTAVVRHRHSATSGRSELFRFHDQRNRLLTLRKNATARLWVGALLRYKLTALSALLRRRDLADFRLRVRVLASYYRLLPRMIGRRRVTSRRATVSRRELQRWLA